MLSIPACGSFPVWVPGCNFPFSKQPGASCSSASRAPRRAAGVLHEGTLLMEKCSILRGDFPLNFHSAAGARIPKSAARWNNGCPREGRVRFLAGECRITLTRHRNGCGAEDFFSSSIHRSKVGALVHSRKERWWPSGAAKSGYAETENPSSSSSARKLAEDSSSGNGEDGAELARQSKVLEFSQRMLDGAKAQVIVVVDNFKNLDAEKVKHSLDVRRLRNVDVEKLKGRLDVRKLKNVDMNKLVSRVEEYTADLPLPPYTSKVVTGVGISFVAGIVLDTFIYRLSRMGSRRKKGPVSGDGVGADSLLSRTPSGLSMLLERDLRRKESVEWVNMVIGKLWNLYRKRMEGMAVEMLQPSLDDLEKPNIVDKVELQDLFLGDDPLTIRTVERRTSRRADDLQYHIGVRYTGGARLLLGAKLKLGPISGTVPVGVRGLDVDAEVWVKIRMLPCEPWIGTATWAFVTMPTIKLALAPFRLVNLMDIPFLSMFLAKLLTEDLPAEFVQPNKNVIDFLQGQALGPASEDGIGFDGSKSFSGELTVTLVEARKMSYIPYLRTDPYCILNLSEQVQRSKRNSQTSTLGPPGAPVWNQDFKMLVVDNKIEHLHVTLYDTLGFTSYPVGSADIDIRTLQDTVPVDRKITLKSGWGPFPRRFAGELVVRLTYKAYIDDEDGGVGGEFTPKGEVTQVQEVATFFKEEAGKVAELFEDSAAAKETLSNLKPISSPKDMSKALPLLGLEPNSEEIINDPSATGTGTPLVRTSPNGTSKRNTKTLETNGGARRGIPTSSDIRVQVDRDTVGQVVVSNTAEKRPKGTNGSAKDDKRPSLRNVLLWLTGATVLLWILAADFNLADLFS